MNTRQYYQQKADYALRKSLQGKLLILLDRFGSAYRNVYAVSEFTISSILPQVAICNYGTWGNKKPHIIFSQEQQTHIRKKKLANKYDQDSLQFLKQYKYKSSYRKPVFLTWYQTELRKKIANELDGLLLAVSKHIRNKLENKVNFYSLLNLVGIPKNYQLNTLIFSSSKTISSYEELIRQVGKIFVMQGDSMGGSGTVIVKSSIDYKNAVNRLEGKIRISQYCNGQYFSVSVLTVPKDRNNCNVYIDIPTHKTTDIPEVGVSAIMGAGNDYSLTYRTLDAEKFVTYIKKIAIYAYQAYKLVGVWAIEGFIDEKAFYFNEINCRPVGGTEVSSANQFLRNFPPFIVIHNLIFLKGDISWLPSGDKFNQETVQIINRQMNRGPFYLKIKAKYNCPVKVKQEFQGNGIYTLTRNNTLRWLKQGQSTLEANFDNNEILVADIPFKNSICYPGVELCTLEGVGYKNHIFNGPHQLTKKGYRIAEAIYKNFEPLK